MTTSLIFRQFLGPDFLAVTVHMWFIVVCTHVPTSILFIVMMAFDLDSFRVYY